MGQLATISDLREADSAEAFPGGFFAQPWLSQLEDRVQRAGRRLSKITGGDWTIVGPHEFQDGPLFAYMTSGGPGVPSVLLFSKFGNLFTIGRFANPPYQHSPEELEKLISLLGRDYSFRFVPAHLLNEDYSGVLVRYRMGTWFQRYFADVYWAAGKPHEGQLRWP